MIGTWDKNYKFTRECEIEAEHNQVCDDVDECDECDRPACEVIDGRFFCDECGKEFRISGLFRTD